MRLFTALVLSVALLPGGSTIMPVWGRPATGQAEHPAQQHAIVPPPQAGERAGKHAGEHAATLRPRAGGDFRRLRLAGPFPAVVTDVVDGDTFEARVTIWLGHEVTTRVRLLGIDAAEMGAECGEERALAQLSRTALGTMLAGPVELSDVRFDKYGGRVLARARSQTHRDISEAMLAGGYALAYEGGRRQAWCDPVLTSRK